MATIPPQDLPGRPGRRVILVSVLGTIGRVVAVLAIYFLIPMDRAMNVATVTGLTLEVLALCGILTWQLRRIVSSRYPGLRALEALGFTIPLFVLLFATAYFLLGNVQAASFSQSLTRVDAMYFAVTVFTTVGFGDITAKSETARIAVTVQMMLDLLILGLVIRLVIHAIKIGQQRQRT
ncbi:potassium channel family protein [Streptomyces vinaceus]|uniref:potassium channel family protein n=1 Tax=Streptomyces vinaceus TaxID=1960 RepID=UPI00380B0B9E